MTAYGPYPATVSTVHDGDTARLVLNLGFGINMSLSCRIDGINAPELNAAGGGEAREYLLSIMPADTQVRVVSTGWDKYGGRFDGIITLPDGTDVGQQMVNTGHAKPWDGRGVKP